MGDTTARAVRGGSPSRLNLLIALTAAAVGLIYGYDLGSIASAILFLQEDLDASTFEVSLITSYVVLGQLVGALAGGRIANRYGRKRTMVAIAIGFAVFAVAQGLAPDKWTLTGARFLLGFVIGVSIVAAPAYIAESAPARIRGAMLVTFQIATTSGIAISYFVGVALAGSENWRLILGLSAVPALIVLALVVRLPDTARWHMMQGRRPEAIAILRRTDPDQDAEREADIIEEDLSHDEKGSFAELFRGRFR